MEDISDHTYDIAILKNAINNKHVITATYDYVEYKQELKVKPLKIANYEGLWYLIALDAR